ncbi:unnamed protein product [Blepharisma stoltei]|uniref:Uncharacterized protein n=1 Tax=Blepharisma stoltei TaxID=1481888 RepID=A0AAU9JUI1_9CILI|nr:unnamed protein product [Blepharisma stoltei]
MSQAVENPFEENLQFEESPKFGEASPKRDSEGSLYDNYGLSKPEEVVEYENAMNEVSEKLSKASEYVESLKQKKVKHQKELEILEQESESFLYENESVKKKIEAMEKDLNQLQISQKRTASTHASISPSEQNFSLVSNDSSKSESNTVNALKAQIAELKKVFQNQEQALQKFQHIVQETNEDNEQFNNFLGGFENDRSKVSFLMNSFALRKSMFVDGPSIIPMSPVLKADDDSSLFASSLLGFESDSEFVDEEGSKILINLSDEEETPKKKPKKPETPVKLYRRDRHIRRPRSLIEKIMFRSHLCLFHI